MKSLIFVSITALILLSCSSKVETYGEAPQSASTALTKLLSAPEHFDKKEVTLTGVVDGQCGNRCEFTFREGSEAVTIYMGDIEAPMIQKGTPVTVTAKVHKGEKKLVLTAQGFTLDKGGK